MFKLLFLMTIQKASPSNLCLLSCANISSNPKSNSPHHPFQPLIATFPRSVCCALLSIHQNFWHNNLAAPSLATFSSCSFFFLLASHISTTFRIKMPLFASFPSSPFCGQSQSAQTRSGNANRQRRNAAATAESNVVLCGQRNSRRDSSHSIPHTHIWLDELAS